MKDKLFLMKPGFKIEEKGPYYCSDSVSVEGLLGFFPELREKVDVTYIAFPRPRGAVVDLIGADHQSIPVLVLADGRVVKDGSIAVSTAQGHGYIDSEADIRKYLSSQYGVAQAS
jgi:hypothetical protein